jgi:hypothetical protein
MAEVISSQLPQLLDLRALGAYLGCSWRTLERQLLARAQIDAWLSGNQIQSRHQLVNPR